MAFLFLSLKEKQRLYTSYKFQSVQYIWLLFVFELADLNMHQMMLMVTIEMQWYMLQLFWSVETGTINMYKYNVYNNLRAYWGLNGKCSVLIVLLWFSMNIAFLVKLFCMRGMNIFLILCTSPENLKTEARAYVECVKLRFRIKNDKYFVIISWNGKWDNCI